MDIAIVVGGAAAVGLLDALATQPTHATGVADAAVGRIDTITVFEPSPHLWQGRPYGPELAAVLVNTPPALMSVCARDRDHFAAWLGQRVADHLDPLLGQPLVPRALYGEYLVHSAEKAVAALGGTGPPGARRTGAGARCRRRHRLAAGAAHG